MLNIMIVFRALIARTEDRARIAAPSHSETELRAFERALKRRVELGQAAA
jgi:hypothetical protein